jgi:hypothetical protein
MLMDAEVNYCWAASSGCITWGNIDASEYWGKQMLKRIALANNTCLNVPNIKVIDGTSDWLDGKGNAGLHMMDNLRS